VNLLAIPGSLRKGSYTRAVARSLSDMSPPGVFVECFELHDLPLYNEDDDGESAPDAVRRLREAIQRSAGVIVVSPEYNCGMSGVMKNALDWASRPWGASPLLNKPVLIMTASPATTGGARAQVQLLDCLFAIPARVVQTPQVVISQAHRKVEDGRLTDPATRDFVRTAIEALGAEAARARQGSGLHPGGRPMED
jgi:chromate reductase